MMRGNLWTKSQRTCLISLCDEQTRVTAVSRRYHETQSSMRAEFLLIVLRRLCPKSMSVIACGC
jgi:hypothetical protein